MLIIINSSPLIFLAKLGYLAVFLETTDNFYIPRSVADEIEAKSDLSSQIIRALITSGNLKIREASFTPLVTILNRQLGKGESEAIALAIELNANYILLDDAAARREAKKLGLNVRGTLAVIRKLRESGTIEIDSLDVLYQKLGEIDFRIKRALFDRVFSDL